MSFSEETSQKRDKAFIFTVHEQLREGRFK